MRPLFEITSDLVRLNELLDEYGGEIPPDAAGIDSWMDALAGEEAQKLDSYINLVKTLELEAAAARAEAEQYLAKARARERRAEWLRDRLKAHLEATAQTKVRTAAGRTVAVQKNGGPPPLIVDDDALEKMGIGDRNCFVVVSEAVDKGAIRTALMAGHPPMSFARLGEPGTHLKVS